VTVGALFGEAARDYYRTRRRLVPGFDRFYGAALESVPFAEEQEIKVLDLGAGTGLLSAMVAEKFSRWRVTLVDLSVEMLRVARRRFTSEPGRFEFRTMDYARKPLPSRDGGYDLVVSALSIHHLTPGDKQEVFGKVRRSLAAGGYFRQRGPNRGRHARGGDALQGLVVEAGAWGRRLRKDLDVALLRIRADKNATLSAQLLWLREAGFGGVDCRYRDHMFVVYGGKKINEVSKGGKDDNG
jgi:tRNA (cmo5U34)-methyltransferase